MRSLLSNTLQNSHDLIYFTFHLVHVTTCIKVKVQIIGRGKRNEKHKLLLTRRMRWEGKCIGLYVIHRVIKRLNL
jgi:hypothetical protein